MNALAELGPKGFIKTLSDLPRVGGFGGPGAAGYPIRYATKAIGRDGRERITMATDRDAAFWEVANRTRSLDYPVTWIEMTLRPNGEGDGQVSVAAKVAIDRPRRRSSWRTSTSTRCGSPQSSGRSSRLYNTGQ